MSHRIMIVEDDPVIAGSMSKFIAGWGHPDGPDDLPGGVFPAVPPEDGNQLVHGHLDAANPQIQYQERQ